MKKLFSVSVLCAMLSGLFWTNPSVAASSSDIDDLTTYAVLIGRGIGCGFNMRSEMRQVGAWIDRTFYGQEKSMYLKLFMAGVEHNAAEQAAGRSPDSCSSLRGTLDRVDWP